MSTLRYRSLCRYAAVLCLWAACAACSFVKAENSVPSPSPETVTSIVVAPGRITPKGDVIKISVANAQDSRINQILVDEGEFVRANQVIAVLQGKDKVQQQLREAEANVAIKRAQLVKTQQGDAKLAEISAQSAQVAETTARLNTETVEKQAAITEAEASLRNAELNYQRYQSLAQEGAVKQSDLDDAQEKFETAKATLAQSQAALATTTATLKAQLDRERATLQQLREVRPVDIEIAEAELAQALIQVEQRRAELEDTEVRVPLAGQILKINTRVGEQVNTSEGIAELGQTDQMYAIAEVYETDISKVRIGQRATLSSEYGGLSGSLQGKVEQIGRQIRESSQTQDTSDPTRDANARVVEVKIRLDPTDSSKVAALTGMQVRIKIDTASLP